MKFKYTFRYAFVGALFGLSFPIFALFIDILYHGLPLILANFALVQAKNPLLWIIDTAPIFLGIFAGLAGVRQDQLVQKYAELEAEIFVRKQAHAEIDKLNKKLEKEVYERTRALETSTEINRRLSTILNQDVLVREVVEQVQKAFNYYHTQIYLFDDLREKLIMVGGTGTPGRILLEKGHAIPKGRGLVGKAGNTNLPIWEFDVSKAKDWLPNPLLPETRAEAAIPIAIGDDVLGVLDVQENKVSGLTEADVDLLQSIANQVATVLQNARAYQHSQKQVEREALMASINQQIQSTTDVEDALQVTVRELGRALGSDTSIRLIAKSNGEENNKQPIY